MGATPTLNHDDCRIRLKQTTAKRPEYNILRSQLRWYQDIPRQRPQSLCIDRPSIHAAHARAACHTRENYHTSNIPALHGTMNRAYGPHEGTKGSVINQQSQHNRWRHTQADGTDNYRHTTNIPVTNITKPNVDTPSSRLRWKCMKSTGLLLTLPIHEEDIGAVHTFINNPALPTNPYLFLHHARRAPTHGRALQCSVLAVGGGSYKHIDNGQKYKMEQVYQKLHRYSMWTSIARMAWTTPSKHAIHARGTR